MNPLPNRPLLNSSAPLSLPNVPSFDQIAYNGRPRKVLPEGGKEFPLLNGMNSISGTPSAGTPNGTPQLSSLLDHNTHSNAGTGSQQPSLSQLTPQLNGPPQELSSNTQTEKEGESENENRQRTAFFRDEAGEWKEKLRRSHEEAEKAKLARELSQSTATDSGSWERPGEDEEPKEEEGDVDDDESTLVGEGEGTKLWKAKRTLRKLVFS